MMPSCTYCAHAASCCNVRRAGSLTGSGEHSHGIGIEPTGNLRDQGQAFLCMAAISCAACHAVARRSAIETVPVMRPVASAYNTP